MSALKTLQESEMLLPAEEEILRDVQEGKARVSRLKEKRRCLLGIEQVAADALREQEDESHTKVADLRRTSKLRKKMSETKGAKILSLDAFRLRNRDGSPKLAVFSLKHPDFTISTEEYGLLDNPGNGRLADIVGYALIIATFIGSIAFFEMMFHWGRIGWFWEGLVGGVAGVVAVVLECLIMFDLAGWIYHKTHDAWLWPILPKEMASCYEDVIETLREKKRVMGSKKGLEWKASYRGVIPDEVKGKIKQARRIFKQVFIVAEPEKWSLEKVTYPPGDPLVVGWDGKLLWLVDSFDTTPLEEYVKLEYATKKE
jgi:hypothetical protein